MVWFLCLISWIIYTKDFFIEEQLWYYLTQSWNDKWIHTFLKSSGMKVNLIPQLEFELAYYYVVVQHARHYATENPLPKKYICSKLLDMFGPRSRRFSLMIFFYLFCDCVWYWLSLVHLNYNFCALFGILNISVSTKSTEQPKQIKLIIYHTKS